jgi:hypothetical protein
MLRRTLASSAPNTGGAVTLSIRSPSKLTGKRIVRNSP